MSPTPNSYRATTASVLKPRYRLLLSSTPPTRPHRVLLSPQATPSYTPHALPYTHTHTTHALAEPSQPCRPQPPSSTSSPKTVRPPIRAPSAPADKHVAEKGNEHPLDSYKGKVVLVVNTASKCGFTPQLEGLEKLYKDLKTSHPDFTVLGFPCNQFGGQDPGTNDEIQEFCLVNYGVSFPILGKVDVNGDNAEPVFEWLKKEKPGVMGLKRVKWNFEKFLIGRDGKVIKRWASLTKPEDLKADIEKALAAK